MKALAYWIIPLAVFMSSIYAIVFSKQSFPLMIFVTIGMLHPAIVIPFTYLIEKSRYITSWMVKHLTEVSCKSGIYQERGPKGPHF